MEMEEKKPGCPILDVDGVISGGKQFDLDITLPEDNRDAVSYTHLYNFVFYCIYMQCFCCL